MGNTLFSAYVDENGKVHESIGENIRKGAKDPDSIVGSFKNNTDSAKMASALHVSSADLKEAIVDLLSGKKANFGGLDVTPLSTTQLNDIKAYLGITA